MSLEEKIRITGVEELARLEDEESQKLVDSVASDLRGSIGREVKLAKFNDLLDKVGERLSEGGWQTLNIILPIEANEYPIYRKYEGAMIYCVVLPLTEYRKRILRNRMRKEGAIKCQKHNGSFVSVDKYDEFDDGGLWLYLRKTPSRKQFRIGIMDVYMKQAGMGVVPSIGKAQDLLSFNVTPNCQG